MVMDGLGKNYMVPWRKTKDVQIKLIVGRLCLWAFITEHLINQRWLDKLGATIRKSGARCCGSTLKPLSMNKA